jgi:pimeloyl-ACP methyl ester carboxylesterase
LTDAGHRSTENPAGTASRQVRVDPYRPRLDVEVLAELRRRLAVTRPSPSPVAAGWERGVEARWLEDLLRDWAEFDVAGFQQTLTELPHLTAEIGEMTVHLVHVPGSGPDPMPLLLTHGWPGSFLEYWPVISALTDPEAHGGDPADAFSVVIPSLPGFGFSGPPPPSGLSHDDVAELWDRLMSEGLGYQRYVAHGSDLGAGITARLARAHPEHVAGIHLATPGLPAAPKPPLTTAEASYLEAAATWVSEEGGYAHQQSTKPTTLATALADSPAGLAAWIGEKVIAWSSTRDDGRPAFDRELLLGTLTLYWATNTIGSSLLPYWAGRHLPVTDLSEGAPSSVPTAISIFGGERIPFPKPPREMAARYFNLIRWAEHDRGGHFPAVAEPDLLVDVLRATFRSTKIEMI